METEALARFSHLSLPSPLTMRPVTVKTGQLRPPLTTTAIRPVAAAGIRAPRPTPPAITTITILEAEATSSAATRPTRSSIRVSTKAQRRPDSTRNRHRISVTFSRHNRSRPVQRANPQTNLVNNISMKIQSYLFFFFVLRAEVPNLFYSKKNDLSAASAVSTRILIYVFNLIHFINGYRLVPFNLLIFCLSANMSCFDLFQPICPFLPDFNPYNP